MKKITNGIVISLLSLGVVYFAYQAHEWKEAANVYEKITLDQNGEIDYRERLLGKALNKETFSYKETEDIKDILFRYDTKGKTEEEIYKETATGTDSRFNHFDHYEFNRIDKDGNYIFVSLTDGSEYFLYPDEVRQAKIKKGDKISIVSNEYGEFISAKSIKSKKQL
ncbi:hypothetical protein P9D57_17640 [Bacillus sonorensis]|uniref:hypothetical protein n=1 Tax=Bacillus sonorensis TaxID=119858 RepID=UPI002DBFB9E5|nr:hypothetical protein [Bacillus sonorensis]MEC1440514.1 hypothetical protein [Bacillus sonorensis]